jgi:hypothetical protein
MKIAGILAIGLLGACMSPGASSSDGVPYHSDPRHLWNRLHQALFVRVAPGDGERFGDAELDILFWDSSKHLLVSPSREQSIQVLDEFIRERGERLIRDPLKRAWLQRELWALFDWSARPRATSADDSPESRARSELQRKLAAIIARLALTPQEIDALPDNLAEAGKRLQGADFPDGLGAPDSEWVLVGRPDDLTAKEHAVAFGGRSTFLVFVKVPGGRAETLRYLKELREFNPALVYSGERLPGMPNFQGRRRLGTNPATPQFPADTQWVLLRRMNLIDDGGQIRATRLAESLQTRRYATIPDTDRDFNLLATSQVPAEFQADRANLPALRAVAVGERDFHFVHFRSMGVDPFEYAGNEDWARRRNRLRAETLRTCGSCHVARGILSVNTYTSFGTDAAELDGSTFEREAEATIAWKRRQYDWGLLRGLWPR